VVVFSGRESTERWDFLPPGCTRVDEVFICFSCMCHVRCCSSMAITYPRCRLFIVTCLEHVLYRGWRDIWLRRTIVVLFNMSCAHPWLEPRGVNEEVEVLRLLLLRRRACSGLPVSGAEMRFLGWNCSSASVSHGAGIHATSSRFLSASAVAKLGPRDGDVVQ
jgi:hypothetical protein